jgi:hypothetical protein
MACAGSAVLCKEVQQPREKYRAGEIRTRDLLNPIQFYIAKTQSRKPLVWWEEK